MRDKNCLKVKKEVYKDKTPVAEEVMKGIDITDSPFLALALTLNCQIWSNDGHLRGQIDCFDVLKGALKICAYDDETEELDEIVSTGESLQVVRIPGQYWHGFKVVGDDRAYLVYFVNRLYDYEDPDEERRA